MNDFSILLIKPEIINKKEKIINSLEERGYRIFLEKEFTNWRNIYCKKLYTEFSPEQIEIYIKGYNKHKFDDKITVLVVTHIESNTLDKLKKEQGNFIGYQNLKGKTLRIEFGLPEKYNIKHRGITFTYSGIHCPENKEELKSLLKIFKISLPNDLK